MAGTSPLNGLDQHSGVQLDDKEWFRVVARGLRQRRTPEGMPFRHGSADSLRHLLRRRGQMKWTAEPCCLNNGADAGAPLKKPAMTDYVCWWHEAVD